MSRGAQSDFTKVATAIAKIMAKAGLKDWRMEVEPGKIAVVVASEPDKAGALTETSADLRRLL